MIKAAEIVLPKGRGDGVEEALLSLLLLFGRVSSSGIDFRSSDPQHLPAVSLRFDDTVTVPQARFYFDDAAEQVVEIVNSTDKTKTNPASYQHISFEQFTERLVPYNFSRLDHVGFDLPHFGGVHPQLQEIVSHLARQGAYYKLDTSDPLVGFIIPATAGEIASGQELSFTKPRTPKFEIVSLDKVSTPIVQFDVSLGNRQVDLAALFPEGIYDRKLDNVWVYLSNPYNLDICFVIGNPAPFPEDWGHYHLAGKRQK